MKRIVAIILTFCIVCSGLGICNVSAANSGRIVYVPLDDRPFHVDRVQLLADSLGLDLIMPPDDLISPNFDQMTKAQTQAYCQKLLLWLQRQQSSADTFILSLDMLLSGGLLNSRYLEDSEDIRFETSVIDFIAQLSKTKTVYVTDSVMRLATSCSDEESTLEYTLFRAYGQAPRPVLSDAELEEDPILAITSAYRLYSDRSPAYLHCGLTEAQIMRLLSFYDGSYSSAASGFRFYHGSPLVDMTDDAAEVLSPEATIQQDLSMAAEPTLALSEDAQNAAVRYASSYAEDQNSLLRYYLSVRTRKLKLTHYALQAFSETSVRYLLGIDDSVAGNCIQSNEIRLFQRCMKPQDLLTSSVDGLGVLAVAEAYRTQSGAASPSLSITCFGDHPEDVPSYGHDSIPKLLSDTADYLGAEIKSEGGDISVLVFTAVDTDASYHRELNELVSKLNENEYDQIPTILIDLSEDSVSLLDQMLVGNTHLGMLLSFSGSYEQPNSVTMALAQGIAAYWQLTMPALQKSTNEKARLQNLLSGLGKEIVYHDQVSKQMEKALRGMGLSSFFVSASSGEKRTIQGQLASAMKTESETLMQNLIGSNYLASLAPYCVKSLSSCSIASCSFPWDRTFEIQCEFSFTCSDQAKDPGTFHRSYTSGTSIDTFSPDLPLTRAAAVKLLLSVGEADLQSASGVPFTDTAYHWANAYILCASSQNYVNGYTDGSFRPDQSMTRSEFITVLYRYLSNNHIPLSHVSVSAFRDVPKDSGVWYAQALYALGNAGIVSGDEAGNFNPNAPITRAQAIAMLNRMFGRRSSPDSLMTLRRFTDTGRSLWYFRDIQGAAISHYDK